MTDDKLYEPCKTCGAAVFKTAVICHSCGAKRKIGWLGSIKIWHIVTMLVLLYSINSFQKTDTPSSQVPKVAANMPVLANVRLDYKWSTGGFGSVMEADFTVFNDSDFNIKDIDIRCDHFAPSGTVIDQNEKTIFEIVPAKSKRTFLKFNMGFIHSQVNKSDCFIKKYVKQ